MIRFSNWIISPQREVIARQHDNLTGRLEVLGDLPEGWIWDMLVRVGHYRDVLSLTPCDGGVGIDLSAEMLCVGGSYTMQLRGTQGELVRHTNQVTVYIPASLSGDEWWPELPSEFSQAEQRVRQCVEQATQEANRAESGADAAQKGAEAAKGAANQAEQSAVAAQEANKGSEAAADQAKQSADQAAQEAEAVRETAGVAQEAARLAGQSAAAAQAARDGSEAAASRAGQSADQAAQKADAAASSASDAKKAQQAVENMTASAETLAPDAQASVTKTTQDDVVNLKFGIPQGQPGQNGGYYQPSVSEDGQLAFNPSQEDMPAVPSAYIKGPPGQDAPQIDDSRVSSATPWSSRQIVDTLAPEFEVSGPVVTCTPVAGYPLHVVSQIMPVQEGEGDPSPDNVRPIRGWTEANLWVAGKNLWDNDYAMNPDNWENGTYYALRLPLAPNATYTLSMSKNNMFKNYNPDYNGKFSFYLGEIPYTSVGNKLIGNATVFDVPLTYTFSTSDKPMYANLYSRAYGESGFEITFTELLVNLQIEAGSTPTPYTPYNPASKTITLPFGQTVYGGDLDWTTGVLTVEWASVVLTGNENWAQAEYIVLVDATNRPANPNPGIGYCSHFPFAYNYNGDNIFITRSIVYLGTRLSAKYTIDEWKSYLAAQYAAGTPVTITYQLATPEPFAVTPQEVLALSGTNTLYTDTGDTTVSGRENPLTVIQRLSERIAALEFNMNLLSDYQRGDMT